MRQFKAIINVDLDGVVYDFGGDIRRFIANEEGVSPADVYVPSWGVRDGKFDRWWRMAVEEGWVWGRYGSPPMEGSREYMWKLSDEEYYIRLVTLRLVQSWNHAKIITNTTEWLDMHNIPYREICYIGPGTKKSDFRADYAIDDRPLHIQEYVDSGIEGRLLRQPWNVDSDIEYVVDDWEEFYDVVTGR